MSKVKIRTLLHNEKENKFYSDEVIGIKDNKIKFVSEGVTNIIEISNNIINLKRRSSEYEIDMIFELNSVTKGKYMVNDLGYFNLEIKTNKLLIKENYIEVEYLMNLEGEKTCFNYKIEVEDL